MGSRRWWTWGIAIVLVGVVGAGAVAWSVDAVRWRATLVSHKLTGRVVDLSWGELVRLLPPGSGVNLRPVLGTHNPFTAIHNPRTAPADLRQGGELFGRECSQCHGADGKGGTGPDLTQGDFRYGSSDWALFRTISRGIDGTAMRPRDLPADRVWQLVAFVQRAAGGTAAAADGPSIAPIAPITFEQLAAASQDSRQWLTYSGAYNGQRFSHLSQITRENVTQLAVKWLFQFPTSSPLVESHPLVAGNVMFATLPPGDVWALDARTGQVLWQYRGAPAPRDLKISVTPVHRGLAILGDTLFVPRTDAYLVALDARTGQERWKTRVADYREGYSMTGAPLALRDLIVVGVGGGEFGTRGFLDAYSPVDGSRVWRFNTVPGPGEPGHDTWGGSSWERGSAPTWLTGSFDPDLDVVYWGVGNPGPDYQGDVRPGDNLYSNSVIALDARTGRLRWHFQFTPHDEHDWDSTQIPVLVDHEYGGQPRKLLLWANRNGFYYVLDRVTGEFLHARAFVKQTWAERMDEKGRPVPLPSARPTREGAVVFPSWSGGTNWWSPSYDPGLHTFFVAAKDGSGVFTNSPVLTVRDGSYNASSAGAGPGRSESSIQALDASTGALRWRRSITDRQPLGGLTATAGGLVFGSDAADMLALDTRDGQVLWRLNAGGTIAAAPITYLADQQQHVTVAAGRVLLTLSLGSR